MHSWVYRRPFDYRAPATPRRLLWPAAQLEVEASEAELTLTQQAAAIELTTGATPAELSLSGQAAEARLSKQVDAIERTLALVGAHASAALKPVGTFDMRDVPGHVPEIRLGVFRGGFVLRPARRTAFFPAFQTTGQIDATRWSLTLSGQQADVQFVETTRQWILMEAVRRIAQRSAWRELPRDTRAWDERIVQFRLDPGALTAYAATLTLTGRAGAVKVSRNVQAALAHLTLANPNALARLSKAILATVGTLTLAGQQSRVGTGATIPAVEGALVLAENGAAIKFDRGIEARESNLVLVELVASLGQALNVATTVSALTLGGQGSTVELQGAVSALAAELALASVSATASLGLDANAGAEDLALSEPAAQLAFERRVMAAVGRLSIAHQQAIISGSQAVIVTVGKRTVRVRARRTTVTVH